MSEPLQSSLGAADPILASASMAGFPAPRKGGLFDFLDHIRQLEHKAKDASNAPAPPPAAAPLRTAHRMDAAAASTDSGGAMLRTAHQMEAASSSSPAAPTPPPGISSSPSLNPPPSSQPSSTSAASPSTNSLPSASTSPAGAIRLGRSARALLVTSSGSVYPLTADEAAVGTKAGRCQVVVGGCSELSAVHLLFSFDRLQQRWQVQVLGRTGASLQGRHLFPSSLHHPLNSSAALILPCSNPSHCHLLQISLPQQSKRSSALSLAARREAEEANMNRPEWSDAEQLRFQRSFMSFGVHGIEQVKRAGYMTKKTVAQLTNYATAFLLECRKQLTDDTERLYVDTVLEKEGWALMQTEPTLSKWRKLQSNASVWIKRLRTIQLLEDLIVTATSQDVDVLSLLPKASIRFNSATAPAPWWDNSHDRLLLHAVFEHGWCRYDDVKADRKYKFLIPTHWSLRVKELNDARDSKEQRRRRLRAGAGEDDDAADDVDDEEEDDREDAAAGEVEKKDGEEPLKPAVAGAPSTSTTTPSADAMIDVNDNAYGITFPNADVLTKRMRRLVENQRKTWWKKKGGSEEREVPVRIRQRRKSSPDDDQPQDEESREGEQRLKRQRRVHEEEARKVWSPAEVHAVVEAVMNLGLEKDQFHRVRWSKVLDYCAHTHSLHISAEEEGKVEQLFLHCLEDHYIQMHSPVLSSLTFFDDLHIVQPSSLISPADGQTLSSRLLFFAKLRSRVLVQSLYTIRTLIDAHHPSLPPSPLPLWYSPGLHDLPLLLGVSKWGVSSQAWQRMADDRELGWKEPARNGEGEEAKVGPRRVEEKEVEDAADQEIQAIIQQDKEESEQTTPPLAVKPEPGRTATTSLVVSPLHYEGLLQRAMDLVDALHPISPVHAPLSTTFSALCPLVPAETSSARRKREAAAQEELAGARRPSSSRRAKRVMKEVSIYQLIGGELSHSSVTFVPSLTRYNAYLFSHPSPIESTVTPFDVTPLSITAVSTSHPTWKPLVRHLKSSVTGVQPTTSPIYACGDRRDEHRLLSPLTATYRAYLAHGQLVLPHWMMGGLTVYALGNVDGRSQCIDERDGERGVWLAPVGYRAVRVHQSFINPNRMARYLCEVIDDAQQPHTSQSPLQLPDPVFPSTSIAFRLTCSDCPDTPLLSSSPHALWSTVSNLIFDMTDAPLASRRNGGSSGWERFGLTHPMVRWMIERSGPIEQCPAYRRQAPITVQLYSKGINRGAGEAAMVS